jgi:hypothetical protein
MPTYAYTVQRNLDGTGANSWLAGDALANTGKPGNGYIHQYATAGRFAGSGPTMVGMVRTGTAHNAVFPRWAIGNLNGLYGYSGNVYGSAFGDPSAAWLKIDPVNGIRIGHAGATKIGLSASGSAFFNEGFVTIDSTGIELAAAITASDTRASYRWGVAEGTLGITGVNAAASSDRAIFISATSTLGYSTFIRLTTGTVVIDGALEFPTNQAGAPAGGIAKNVTNGLHICPVSGGTFDLAITNVANSAYALGLKSGTVNLFIGGVPDFGGGTSTTASAGAQTLPSNPVGFLNVQIAGTNRRIPYYAT